MLGLVAVSTIASPAVAQSSTDRDDTPFLGGSALETQIVNGRAWTLEGRFGTRFDSNFRRTSDSESGVRLSPLVHFGAGLPVGRQQFFFGADIGRDILVNQPRFSRGRFAVGGGVEWRLGKTCSGMVGAEALQRLTAVTEQAELIDNVQNIKALSASVGCRTATGIGFGGSFDRRTIRNDTDIRSPFDLNSTVIAPNVSYGTPTIGQFSLTGTLNDVKYPNRVLPTPTGFVEDGVKIMQGRFGYQRNFGSRLQIGLGLSYLKSSPRPDAVLQIVNNQVLIVPRDDFSGSGYDGTISYQPSSRLNVSLFASRNVNASPNVGALFIIRKAYGADFGYRLGPSINLGLGGFINQNQYEESFTTQGEAARTSDNTKRVYMSANYSPVRLYSIGVELAHQWRRSDPVEFNFDSTTVFLNLRVKFGRG